MINKAWIIAICALVPITTSHAKIIDFNNRAPGPLPSNTYIPTDGFGIYYSDPVVFDSTDAGTPTHQDLVGPPVLNWSGGNLQFDNLGHLIISEGSFAYFIFNFNYGGPIQEFGLSFVLGESPQPTPFQLVIDNGSTRLATLDIFDFTDPSSPYYDNTLSFGSRMANQIQPITAESLGADQITQVAVYIGGPGGISSIYYDRQSTAVPSPSSFLLFLSGLLGFIALKPKKTSSILKEIR